LFWLDRVVGVTRSRQVAEPHRPAATNGGRASPSRSTERIDLKAQEFIAQAVRDLSGELQQLRELRIADRKRRLTAEVRGALPITCAAAISATVEFAFAAWLRCMSL
jgi:hypothetical protein